MSMSDPIADMLTRIRNAHLVAKKQVNIPASRLKSAIASVMQQEGYIESFDVEGEAAAKTLSLKLKYYDGLPVIANLQRISKPSLRVYVGSQSVVLNYYQRLTVAFFSGCFFSIRQKFRLF
ncbi:MAG: 30S ribosomal protein S8 [Candidatus Thioglobus sp.]|nr:30S ribosomal protein S8 [Candidatus Thioglobus sp.]